MNVQQDSLKPGVTRKKTLLICLVAVGLVCGALLAFISELHVVVETDQGTALSVPVPKGGTFSLVYIHSVHKTPVTETFIVAAADDILLRDTTFQSYGVGMPALVGEGRFRQEGGKFILDGLERRFDKLVILASPIAGHALEVSGKIFPLYDLRPGGSAVTIRVKPRYYLWLPNEQRIQP